MRNLLLLLSAAALTASAAPVNVAVTVDNVSYVLNNSTPGTVIQDWSTVTAATPSGFALGSPGAGSIWLTGNPYGLTNTTFTCLAAAGCSGFSFIYTLLGATLGDLMTLDVALEGSTTADALATVFLSCTSTASCLFDVVSGQAALSGTFASTPLLNAHLVLTGPPPANALANAALTLVFQPAGSGLFPSGTVIDLPSSLTVTLTPEPSAWAPAGFVLAGLLARQRRRRPAR